MPLATRYVTLVALVAASTTSVVSAQAQRPRESATPDDVATFVPNVKPEMYLRKTAGSITVDGELNDEGWTDAARAVNFSETFPDDQAKPPIDVTVWSTYDDTHVYFAFRIEDDPASIRSNFSDRDNIWSDDYVGILLDINGDGQEIYFIAANPKGIQGDTRISRSGEDVGFNLIYKSESKVTDDGYQVEMAVPFRSLRFPNKPEQAWRATFWITHPRDSRNTYSWAAIDRDDPCWSCQYGTLRGIAGVHSGGNLELLPSMTGSQSGNLDDEDNPRSFDNNRLNAEPSLDVKYGITSDLTADVTLNPDFSQIEADVAQIDVNSTFSLFFPERRPFFQEGSDLFRTPIRTVYTRSINDPIVASKMTGRFGSTNVAYIGARDNISPIMVPFEESSELVSGGKSISNILRVQHNFPDNSYFGALVTDRRLDAGGSGTTFGVDGAFRFLKKYSLEGQFVAGHTAEVRDTTLSEEFHDQVFDGGKYTAALDGETFWGHALEVELNRDARYWNFEVEYEEKSPTFRAANGFVTQNAFRRLIMFQGLTFYPNKIRFIDRLGPWAHVGRVWNFDGLRKDEWMMAGFWVRMKRQTHLEVEYLIHSTEIFEGIEFKGIRRLEAEVFSNFSKAAQLGMEVSVGRVIARNEDIPELGNSFEFAAEGTFRPTQRLAIQPLFVYSRLRDRETGDTFFDGYIVRARTNYQFTRRFLMRTVVQYNQFDERLEIDPLITYRINPFTAFHFGSTHDYDTFSRTDNVSRYLKQSSRQFFFKFQYLVRS